MHNVRMDDQSSGWLEVKRKNRTNSKSTSHNESEPYSSKSSFPHYQLSTSSGAVERSVKQQALPAQVGPVLPYTAGASSGFSASTLKEDEKNPECFVKQVVKQDGNPVKVEYAKEKHGLVLEASLKENTDKLPKIKWGDLEDDALMVPLFSVNATSRSNNKFADSSSLKAGTSLDSTDTKRNSSSGTNKENEKKEVASEVEIFFDGIPLSSPLEEALEGNWKEVNEISPVQAGSHFFNERINSIVDNHKDSLIQSEHVDNLTLMPSHDLSVDGLIPPRPSEVSEDDTINIHEIPTTSKTMNTAGIRDTVTLEDKCTVKNSAVEASPSASTKENSSSISGLDDNIDAGKINLAESKERFRQRLWCFLFENLNRAVDELYLLCELECDMEQIKEAILVLEESSLDFKELKSRVERFDNTKRFSSQSAADGLLANAKAHQRPHALSWEVRRTTTSPHRAEILSSSLEAFKRIQLERAAKDARHVGEVLNLQHQASQNVFTLDNTQMLLSKASLQTTDQVIKSVVQISETENGKQKGKNIEYREIAECRDEKNNGMIQNCSAVSEINVSQHPLDDSIQNEDMNCRKGSSEPHTDKQPSKREKVFTESRSERHPRPDLLKRQSFPFDKEKERRTSATWKSMDAWKERRNWEDILKSPTRISSKAIHSSSVGRKNVDRARNLHEKLMSPEKKKKTTLDMKREVEEKHARATRIRSQLENERVQRLQRTSEKLNRVNEWQAVRSMKLREGMHVRHQRSESRHEAYLAQVAKRAGDESSKVNEVRFITSLNEENKKLILRQKLHDYELRRTEKLQIMRNKQKEDTAKEEAVFERRKLLEAEKLQRLAETQRKKEEAQLRRVEERKASSAAREARAVEQLRRKEDRAKAQQEEAEILAQKLAEKLSESEQRRKFYLEQIREKASINFRDQSSPLLRRSLNKESQSRSMTSNIEDYQLSCISDAGGTSCINKMTQQQSLKRRVKKIRQRLMALKYDFVEPAVSIENAMFGCRNSIGTAKMKIGRWLQDLQRLRQARKEGFSGIGLIIGDIIKFVEGKEIELHASRQAGLIDFIASALPASHTSRPDASRVTIHLLRLLRVVLTVPANRSYFLSQNLIPPIIPMLSVYLENYIKVAASSNLPGNNNLSNRSNVDDLDSVSEILEGLLWTVAAVFDHANFDERAQHMRDGLAELVVAYQIVNHLRDLFALYDRPQVEGSPFPSSILLSLKLLAVLTSRPNIMPSFDWESHLLKSVSSLCTQETLSEDILPSNLQVSYALKDCDRDCEMPIASRLSQGKLVSYESSCAPKRKQLDVVYGKDHNFISLDVEYCIAATGNSSVAEAFAPNEIRSDEQSKTFSQNGNENIKTDVDGQRSNTSRYVSRAPTETKEAKVKQSDSFLMSAIAETGLVCLPSLLTAVLLQANNRLPSEQSSYNLPSNFEEVSTGVLKILNNLAFLDINFLQDMLARPDLKMEFFHLMSFLLSHCTSKWKAADDQIGFLLLESLSLLGYFALFHPGNQAVLHWGKSPTILHKICDLPFVFFSDPELTPILAGTIVASCYGCDQNRNIVLQEVSVEMLLSLLKSCRHESRHVQAGWSPPKSTSVDAASDNDKAPIEAKKSQIDIALRSSQRSSKNIPSKGISGFNSKARKSRIQKDHRAKACFECPLKTNQPGPGSSFNFSLYARFPSTFLDKAEEFFTAGSDSVLA